MRTYAPGQPHASAGTALNSKRPGPKGPGLLDAELTALKLLASALLKKPPSHDHDLRMASMDRAICALIGSEVSAAILVVRALISFAWLAKTSNC